MRTPSSSPGTRFPPNPGTPPYHRKKGLGNPPGKCDAPAATNLITFGKSVASRRQRPPPAAANLHESPMFSIAHFVRFQRFPDRLESRFAVFVRNQSIFGLHPLPKRPIYRPEPLFSMSTQQLDGAQALIKTLDDLGIEYMFGYPGGAAIPIFDALETIKTKIKFILNRHEQGAATGRRLRPRHRQARRRARHLRPRRRPTPSPPLTAMHGLDPDDRLLRPGRT